MAIRPVMVDQGVVTSKDPSLLEEGELVRADDSQYLPNDPALHKVKGRTKFNAAQEGGGITGARYLEYDGTAADLFVIQVGANYRQATADATGTFSDLVTGLDGTAISLDSVHYNNQHFLLNGVDRNRMVDSDAAVVFHGMLAETSAPALSRDGGDGNTITLDTDNTITYWIERRVKDGDTILRRNAVTSDETVTLTGDGSNDQPLITVPPDPNTDTTHVALFATATNGSFPTGAEVTEVTIEDAQLTDRIQDDRDDNVTNPGLPSGAVYETSVVVFGGATNSVARNGPPPIASTGDVFFDSLVLDDSTDKSVVKYSWADEPEKFPDHNFLRFETKAHDEIHLIRRVGNVCVVAMRDSLWRINWLPRPEDASFQREIAREEIDGAFGCVGPLAGDTFSFGQGPRLAYVTRYGIAVTDGFSWDILTDDVNWENEVSVSSLDRSVLVNNPKQYRLEFYYRAGPVLHRFNEPPPAVPNDACMYIHYHPSHAKQAPTGGSFRAKLTFPINVIGQAAMRAVINRDHFIYTADNTGFLYLENNGVTDTSNAGGIKFNVETRDNYMSGLGKETKLRAVWTHHGASGPGRSATFTATMINSGKDPQPKSRVFSTERREPTPTYGETYAEAHRFGVEDETDGTMSVNYFVVDMDDFGKTERP